MTFKEFTCPPTRVERLLLKEFRLEVSAPYGTLPKAPVSPSGNATGIAVETQLRIHKDRGFTDGLLSDFKQVKEGSHQPLPNTFLHPCEE
jgi:hypothetical protein